MTNTPRPSVLLEEADTSIIRYARHRIDPATVRWFGSCALPWAGAHTNRERLPDAGQPAIEESPPPRR